MTRKEHRVTKKHAKAYFNKAGLFLIMYSLIVLILPILLHYYMVVSDSEILKDQLMYFGIYFIILLFGTLLPFLLMRLMFHLPTKKIIRTINATFVDLFVQTIVFFTVCIALTYVSNLLCSYLGVASKLLSGIGLSYEDANLTYPLYIFMLIVVTPLIEEYAFRGVLLNVLAKFGKRFGLIASAVIFALAHMNFAEMIPAFAMGIVLGKASLRYKSIQPTIIIHMLFNALIFFLCVMPASFTRYMAYGLTVIVVLAFYLIFTGRYQRVRIQHLPSSKKAALLFFTAPTVVIACLLMIGASVLYVFLQ